VDALCFGVERGASSGGGLCAYIKWGDVAVCCSVPQCVAQCFGVERMALCGSGTCTCIKWALLQCIKMYRSVSQCVAVCRSVSHSVLVWRYVLSVELHGMCAYKCVCCSVLQGVASCSVVLWCGERSSVLRWIVCMYSAGVWEWFGCLV